jgi:anti-sigma-K factor RskA
MDADSVALAGELVIGTLPMAERAAAAARAAADPAFAAEVRAWEQRLSGLLTSAVPIPPSDLAWKRINRRLDGGPSSPGRVPKVWRGLMLTTSAMAAAFAAIIVMRPQPEAPQPRVVQVAAKPQPLTVASLSETGAKTGLLLTIDERTGEVFAQPVGLPSPKGHSLELWTIVGTAPPRSLGLLSATQPARFHLKPGEAVPGAKFAISVEPEGGSPKPTPTGPVTFMGEAVRLPARS